MDLDFCRPKAYLAKTFSNRAYPACLPSFLLKHCLWCLWKISRLIFNRLDQRVVVKRSGLPTLLSTPNHRQVVLKKIFNLGYNWFFFFDVRYSWSDIRVLFREFLYSLPSVYFDVLIFRYLIFWHLDILIFWYLDTFDKFDNFDTFDNLISNIW